MSTIKVEREKCCGDGACISVCPIQILIMDGEDHMPKLVDGADKACINCGHCVSVCPKAAISLSSMPVEMCLPLAKDWRMPPEKLLQLLKGRRSIRRYKDEPVSREIIEKLIYAASYAPSGINRQPVNWAVVNDAKKVKELSCLVIEWMKGLVRENSQLALSLRMENTIKMHARGEDPITRGAPNLIIAYSLKDDMTAPQSCTIAVAYMELMAASMGLGSCWAGYLQMAVNMCEDVRKFLGMSKKTAAFGALMIGYSKYEYRRIPLRNQPHIIWR